MVFHRRQSLAHLLSVSFHGLFYFLEGVTIAIHPDDTTSYSANKTNYLVIKEIAFFLKFFFKWFAFSYMKINSRKSCMLFSGDGNVIANRQ